MTLNGLPARKTAPTLRKAQRTFAKHYGLAQVYVTATMRGLNGAALEIMRTRRPTSCANEDPL